MEEREVAILGGGPAGTALGTILQGRGIRTCVVDRKVFPRDKLCGGIVTEKTAALLREVFGERDLPWRHVTPEIELYRGAKRLASATTASSFYLVDRRELDQVLLERYRAAGGTVREGTRVREIRHGERRLILSDGTEISYRILVGADGAGSQVRREVVDPGWRPGAFCVEAERPADGASGPVRIYLSVAQGGYGWRLPKGDHETVGIGGDLGVVRDWRADLTAFSREIGAPVDPGAVRGAPISGGRYVPRPWGDGVLLVGDAAGLVDPITGEGLYLALCSARAAADAVWASMREGESLERGYARRTRRIRALMDSGRRFRRIFYHPRILPKVLDLMRGGQHAPAWFCENVLAEYRCTYDTIVPAYLKYRIGRAIVERGAREHL